jgi:putative hydrolase of the HAD superfamily
LTARAVLLDALGTLVELQPPAPRLRRLLADAGYSVSEAAASRGFAAEIDYYLAHHLEGSDRSAVEALRDRCAEALRAALELPDLDHATARRAMLGALEFRAFADARPALEALRGGGLRLVVVSNWDCTLPDWLEHAGLAQLLDGCVSSAEAGAAKPAPDPFERALETAGVRASEAVHVGDSLHNDVAGARAAGVRPLLIRRSGEAPADVEVVRSLAELVTLV